MSHSATAEIRIGTVLRDTYELTLLLGKGGMGSVFLARHLRLPGKQVAVKVLLHSEDLSEEQFGRFRREAEIASQLGHPNIVEVLDFHSLENGTPYMVMEYLRGESLAQRLRKGRLSMREAFAIARQMGSALQAAHRAGVVHRDLKPANVFLVPTDSEGTVTERVKLLDFGISKLVGSQTLQTQEDVLMGTPRYMAPEQAMGRNREVDARSDIFAFGSIVYEMLCGDSPFAGGTIAEVVYRVVHEQPESLATRVPDLPARAVAAVEKALAKSSKDRFPDVGSFIAELTGTPLQSLAGLGPDPVPMPARGAARPNDASVDESATDATFVPSRAGVSGVAVGSSSDPSIERGSTLEAFRQAGPQPAVQQPSAASMSASRRPTDLELPATPAPSAVPAASRAHPVTEPLPPGQQAGRSKSPLMIAAIGAVVLLAVGVVVGGKLLPSSNPSGPDTPPPVAANDPAPVAANPPVAPTPAAPPETTPPATTPATNPATQTPPATGSTVRKGKPEAVPEEVRTLLEEAQGAMEAGDHDKAIRLAQRAQALKKTEAATTVIVQAYCHKHDLGNARSYWKLLSRQARLEMRGFCKAQGVELID